MKVITDREGHLADQTVAILQHKGLELKWNIKLIDKASIAVGLDIFHQINSFWEKRTLEQQDAIFDVYHRIHVTFDEVWETEELARALLPLVAELEALHPLDDIRHWMDFQSDVKMPSDLKDTFSDSHAAIGTRERTYLREDYKQLVVLSVALRPMLLVWGEYVFRTEKEHGTNWKEYKAFELLGASYILEEGKCPPMERLRKYVELSLPQAKEFDSAILDGLSTEDFSTWVLALVVIRRLTIGDISGTDPDFNLVAFIYRYVGQKVKGHDNSFMGMVKPKIPESQSGDSENNLSKLEGYKVKQEIPAGDIAIIEHYISDTRKLALRVDPSLEMNLGLLEESLESIKQLSSENLWDPQLTLVQWTLGAAVSPRAFPYLSKKSVLEAMGVAQAILWHQKHYVLAALMTAVAQNNSQELQLTGVIPQSRIPQDRLTQLEELFPHSRRQSGKQKSQKEKNVAVISIDKVTKEFREHEWRITVPQKWLAGLDGEDKFLRNNDRRYPVPYDIRVKMADLAISVARQQAASLAK
jgi:hypothetical protein